MAAPAQALLLPLLVRLVLGGVTAGLVSMPVALLFVLVRAQWEPLARLDVGVAAALHELALASPALVLLLQIVAVVLSPTSFQLTVAAVAVWLWRRGGRRLAAWAAVTVVTGGLASRGIKELVERARPALADPVATANGFSFPSGHAVGSFVGCAVLLLLLGPRLSRRRRHAATALAAGLVLLTGFDRVALGVHYVSDVLAGWSVGLAVLTGTSVAFDTWRERTAAGPAQARARREEGPFEAVAAESEETA